jgi:ABC-2 type transport system permease protein
MLKLIQNELMKIFTRPGTYVMIAIMFLIVGITGGIIKYQVNITEKASTEDWRQTLQTEIVEMEKELEEQANAPKMIIDSIERDMAINQYRIDNNLSPYEEYSIWSFVGDASNMILLVGMFSIIIAGGIVASEYNWGTIKLLLIRPIDRGKILVSKYMAVIAFSLILLSASFVFSALMGLILFGTPDSMAPYLNYYKGNITEQNTVLHLAILYGLKFIHIAMFATMAFMISAVFRNSSLAIGLSIFLMMAGGELTGLLAMKFQWAKYVLFANTDLMQYFEGVPLVEGMTLPFSLMMISFYFILFHSLAYLVFKKSDVAG